MCALKHKTRGGESPNGLPKVYFCAHDEDFDRYFEDISDEILKYNRCAIWYPEKGASRDKAFFDDLVEMNMFVMPVTSELLFDEKAAAKQDYAFAAKNNIPVLPLMQEEKLVTAFNEMFGKIQYLNKYDMDASALPYEEKLKNFLDACLLKEEVTRKIRESFDAYLFLSYRKKDRKHAQDLMKLIHKNDFCRDVAIWYDEFLVPGENFQENIQKALGKSHVFVLTVTPNVLEYVENEEGVLEKNYVVRVEFAEAHHTNKDMILPVMMVPTNKDELDEMFERLLPDCTDGLNPQALADSLTEKLAEVHLGQNGHDSQHNYYIGLAYLGGVDVEKNFTTARLLLISSSDDGYADATAKLVDMYYNGIGVGRSLSLAISWQKKLIAQQEKAYQNDPTDSRFHTWFWSIIKCSDFYFEMESSDSLEQAKAQLRNAETACRIRQNKQGSVVPVQYLSVVYERLGDVLRKCDDEPGARDYYARCLKIRKLMGEEGETQRKSLGICYERLGDMAARLFDFDTALDLYHKKLNICLEYCDNTTERDLVDLFNVQFKLAKTYMERGLSLKSDADDDLDSGRKYCDDAIVTAEKLSVGNDSKLGRFRISSAYSVMGKILLNIGELRRVTGREYQEFHDLTDEYISKGLSMAQQMYKAYPRSLEASQYMITAYCRKAEICQGKTSELTMFDHSDQHRLDSGILETLRKDQALLEQAKNYYSKALDLADSAYRNYATVSTAQDLYQCHIKVAKVCRNMLLLPIAPKIRKQFFEKTGRHYEEARKMANYLAHQRNTPGNQERVAEVLFELASLEPKKKAEYLPKAIAIYKELVGKYPNDQKYKNNLMTFEAYLNDEQCFILKN